MAAHICVARIGAAHGVRGAVKLWTFTDDPFAVTRYGPLLTRDGARSFEVAHAREAKGHLVALRQGDLAYLHVHPDADRLKFMATFPTAGAYRLFLQFKVDGSVHTAAFTQEVSP